MWLPIVLILELVCYSQPSMKSYIQVSSLNSLGSRDSQLLLNVQQGQQISTELEYPPIYLLE